VITIDPLQVVSVIGFVVIAIFFAIEYKRWHQIGSIIGPRQRVLRVILMIFMEVLFALVYLGPIVSSSHNAAKELIYYSICIFVGALIVVLALFDLMAIGKGYMTINRRMFGDDRKDDLQGK
jgi:hypothetical protein